MVVLNNNYPKLEYSRIGIFKDTITMLKL